MSRYPAPFADSVWSDRSRIARLRKICDLYTDDALRRGLGASLTDSEVLEAQRILLSAPGPSPSDWAHAESEHGHEVVGFLDAYLRRLPSWIHPAVHYGLTSSDLVEYDLHVAAADHAQFLITLLSTLRDLLDSKANQYAKTPRAGRTHGQTAEVTSLGHQFLVFTETTDRIIRALPTAVPIKSPGPVGHGPRVPLRELSDQTVPSTQVIPRDHLLEWAAAYLRVSNLLNDLATFIRLGARSEIGEFAEGSATDRVGSSAMPGKSNPIDCEKVCGLSRVARANFDALASVTGLWEDRDLSNSSTERIAVPGLASTVEHMTFTMTKVVKDLRVDLDRVSKNVDSPATQANLRQCKVQRDRQVGPIEASRIVKLGEDQ